MFISGLLAKGIAVVCTPRVREIPEFLEEYPDADLVAFCNGRDVDAADVIKKVRGSEYSGILLAACNDPVLQEKQMAAGCTHRLSVEGVEPALLPKIGLTERITDLLA